MKLHEAISELIKQFGPDTLSEKRFVNLLSDYLAFADYPSLQQVVRDFLCDERYSAFIQKLSSTNKADIKLFADKTCLDFQKKTKFKKDLVNYVVDCFLFGLGVSKSVREPSSNGYDAYAEESSNILQSLNEQLDEYKQSYLSLLEELVTVSDDIVFGPVSYYSVEAQNQLYALQLKIYVIVDKIGISDNNWCQELYNAKVETFKKEKNAAVEKRLDEEKRHYTDEVENCIIKPGQSYITKSGYFANDADSRLKPIEDTIEKLNLMIGVIYDAYCQNERNRIIAKYRVTSARRSKQIALKIIAPAAIALGSVFTGGSYLSSQDAISAFDTQMSEVQALNGNGEYAKSIEKSMAARDGYTASFMSSSYKNDAMESADLAFRNLCAQVDKLISDGKYSDANQLIASIPASYLRDNPTSAENAKSLKDKMANVIPEGIENLIQSISKNGGHLTDADHTKLEDLLKLDPANYWLNFIKNKQ